MKLKIHHDTRLIANSYKQGDLLASYFDLKGLFGNGTKTPGKSVVWILEIDGTPIIIHRIIDDKFHATRPIHWNVSGTSLNAVDKLNEYFQMNTDVVVPPTVNYKGW